MKITIMLLLCFALPITAQDKDMKSCPMHEQNKAQANASAQHRAEVEKHSDEAMGFPHDKTMHHFRLDSDGGAIEVIANDSNDATNTQAIRSHLKQIVTMFANGNFSTPMFVHSQTPQGVPVMKQKRAAISYFFEELPAGGRVRIKTTDPEALKAVHEFLRFQIEDHHTGDSEDIA
jgi:hypothetical protein